MLIAERLLYETPFTLSTHTKAHLKEKNCLHKQEKLGRTWIKLTEGFLHCWTIKIEAREKIDKLSRKHKNSLRPEKNLKHK